MHRLQLETVRNVSRRTPPSGLRISKPYYTDTFRELVIRLKNTWRNPSYFRYQEISARTREFCPLHHSSWTCCGEVSFSFTVSQPQASMEADDMAQGFPDMVDKLLPEIGQYLGPKPVVFGNLIPTFFDPAGTDIASWFRYRRVPRDGQQLRHTASKLTKGN